MTRVLWLALVVLAAGCPRKEPAPRPTSAPEGASSAVQEPAAAVPAAGRHSAFGERVSERRAMVRDIAAEGVEDVRVLDAIRKVPRHAFVPESVAPMAYADRPLPIGSGQTISQPFIVAYMTEAVKPAPTDRCLEIGTGSGYQAAVLSELCAKTYSIEYIPELAERAEATLRRLGYAPERLALRAGDGYGGWPSAAPFDAIVVTAAPQQVPQPLLDQLAVGGRLVVPVGGEHETQRLERWTRLKAGNAPEAWRREPLLSVRFVPFLGDAG